MSATGIRSRTFAESWTQTHIIPELADSWTFGGGPLSIGNAVLDDSIANSDITMTLETVSLSSTPNSVTSIFSINIDDDHILPQDKIHHFSFHMNILSDVIDRDGPNFDNCQLYLELAMKRRTLKSTSLDMYHFFNEPTFTLFWDFFDYRFEFKKVILVECNDLFQSQDMTTVAFNF